MPMKSKKALQETKKEQTKDKKQWVKEGSKKDMLMDIVKTASVAKPVDQYWKPIKKLSIPKKK